MNFRNTLPEFYEEVRSLLGGLGRNDLLSQLNDLEIVWCCPCTDPGCASFTVSGSSSPDSFETAGPRRSASPKSLNLEAKRGKVIVGTDPLGRIRSIEILNRPDVRRKLFRAMMAR
ncbi:MAG TPA: hypothetical protein VLR94_07125 [Acidobacteriota bacterium]|nr:hypothetical protein [Acidobacteriota bacterium]